MFVYCRAHINYTFSPVSTHATSTEYIDLTTYVFQDKPKKYWLEDLGLYEADEKCLSDGRWLTDNVIDAAQALSKKAHSYVGGLESVALDKTLAFSVQRGEFVQVFNTTGSHWIMVSNIGCKPGTVNIYDSLPNVNSPSHTREQPPPLCPRKHHHPTNPACPTAAWEC